MKTVGKLTANVGWEMNEVNFVEITLQRYSYFFKCKAGMLYYKNSPDNIFHSHQWGGPSGRRRFDKIDLVIN